MELRITPGLNRPYRLALVEDSNSFTTLSEHDTRAQVIRARDAARRASEVALMELRRIAA